MRAVIVCPGCGADRLIPLTFPVYRREAGPGVMLRCPMAKCSGCGQRIFAPSSPGHGFPSRLKPTERVVVTTPPRRRFPDEGRPPAWRARGLFRKGNEFQGLPRSIALICSAPEP
jgi:hypothetical protein